ncbi:MAG: indole-3-glycerol-phosphate synthase TrpC, partial [Deltaproteobacteria bacterium]|nr:indole-3-glycerol-phosphate synthase TrpC [Deltaproteobacteria bacterium]
MIIDEIVAQKRRTVDGLKQKLSLSDMERAAASGPAPRDFFQALQDGEKPAI